MEDNVKKVKYLVMGIIGLSLVLITGIGMAQKTEDQNLQRAVIKIDTLSCGGCFTTIRAGLNPVEGFSGMGTNLFRKLIAVDFSSPLTTELIAEQLKEIGYPGTLEYVDPITEKESFAYLESKRTGFTAGGGGGCCSGGGYPAANSSLPGSCGLQQGGFMWWISGRDSCPDRRPVIR
jgi:copper chaperone CopZ